MFYADEKYLNLYEKIEQIWLDQERLNIEAELANEAEVIINQLFDHIEKGKICINVKVNNEWVINQWIKKAILLHFILSKNNLFNSGDFTFFDKITPQFTPNHLNELLTRNIRLVPGSYIRKGSFIGNNSVIMPSFINIGAHIGSKTMIDSWATVGSCAYVGNNCHISGGVGIGGVLEPLQAQPVIVEDDCFIGARSEIAEGVIIGKGSVLSMGVYLGASTKIIYRDTGEIIYGKIPEYSVVVPGSTPSANPKMPSLYCAVIIKQVDEKTRSKTSLNELLRI